MTDTPSPAPAPVGAAAVIEIDALTKTYAGGFTALDAVSLEIRDGEILALLGPNGAGKTTLISVICGIATPTSGRVTVDGADIVEDYRKTRALIGLVPQELTTDAFESVWDTVSFSRGLFGKPPDPALIERILKDLSLWDKRDSRLMTLSGGMKRRVMIAKALSHEPRILFLDEPTAGVDVELRKGMWRVVERLRAQGATIILTTHYIEEAEAIADRVAVINKGRIIEVDDKDALMRRLGRKRLIVSLAAPAVAAPSIDGVETRLLHDGTTLEVSYNVERDEGAAARVVSALAASGLAIRDVSSEESSLEEIFVALTHDAATDQPDATTGRAAPEQPLETAS